MPSGFWHIIVPVAKRNLLSNPSLELGTSGWGTLFAGTLGTTSNVQAFGVWAGSVAPSSNGTAGVLGPTFTAGNGSAYAYSFYGSFPVGSAFIAGVGDASGNSVQGSFVGTGGGTWARYIGSFTESAGATRRVAIRKNNSAVTTAFYVDGMMVEAGSFTTYVDGDQAGCVWDGQPHLSQSLRSGTARQGGTIYSLNDLGLSVLEHSGIGMPSVNNAMQNYGLLDGAFYQRTRAEARAFVLTSLFSGTTYPDLHAKRQQVIDVIKPDLTQAPQPARFLYTGAGGSVSIDALYDSGMGFSDREGFSETTTIRVVAPDPYFVSTRDQGTSVPGWATIGSMNHIAYRSQYGQWGTLGVAGTTGGSMMAFLGVEDLLYTNGTLFIAHGFGTFGGTLSPALSLYANGSIGTLTGGTLGATSVSRLAINAAGTLFFGGQSITTIAGTTTRRLGQWNGAFGTLIGTINATPYELNTSVPGTLIVGGQFTTAAGTSAKGIAFYNGGAWGTLIGGTLDAGGADPQVYSVQSVGGRLVVMGVYGSAGGTRADGIALYTGSTWGTYAGGGVGAGGQILSSAVLPDYRIAMTGLFTSVSGQVGTNTGLADLNSITPMGAGIGTPGDNVNFVRVAPSGRAWVGGNVFAGSLTVSGPVVAPSPLWQWTGASWLPGDVRPGTVPGGYNSYRLNAMAFDGAGGMYLGGFFAGIGTVASVAQIVNTGAAAAYPSVTLRNNASGTARVFQVLNTLTNTGAYFNLTMAAGETITITFAPTQTNVISAQRGNLLNTVLPGSNMSKCRIEPGTNYLSVFADSPSLAADWVWRPRAWSADDIL